jgi:hypothetical protein
MKRINRHIVAAALAGIVGITALGLTACPGPDTSTGTKDNLDKHYDADGWNTDDAADLTNGITGTAFDAAGYDRAGYNGAGWDRQHKNKFTGTLYDSTGYDEHGYDSGGYNRNGYNAQGRQNPALIVIPTNGTNVTFATNFGYSEIATTYLVNVDDTLKGNLGGAVADNWFPQLEQQVIDLKAGYSKAEEKYNGFPALSGAEPSTMTNIMLQGGNVDTILTTLFPNTADKANFKALLDVYQKGYYFNQKQRWGDDTTYGSNAKTKATVTAELIDLIGQCGEVILASIDKDASDIITPESLSGILAELKGKLLTKMDNAVGIGGAVTDTIDAANIKALNEHLLTQIGEDRGQLQALVDDLADLTFTSGNITAAIYNGGYQDKTLANAKSGRLHNDSGFNLEFLKPKDNELQVV